MAQQDRSRSKGKTARRGSTAINPNFGSGRQSICDTPPRRSIGRVSGMNNSPSPSKGYRPSISNARSSTAGSRGGPGMKPPTLDKAGLIGFGRESAMHLQVQLAQGNVELPTTGRAKKAGGGMRRNSIGFDAEEAEYKRGLLHSKNGTNQWARRSLVPGEDTALARLRAAERTLAMLLSEIANYRCLIDKETAALQRDEELIAKRYKTLALETHVEKAKLRSASVKGLSRSASTPSKSEVKRAFEIPFAAARGCSTASLVDESSLWSAPPPPQLIGLGAPSQRHPAGPLRSAVEIRAEPVPSYDPGIEKELLEQSDAFRLVCNDTNAANIETLAQIMAARQASDEQPTEEQTTSERALLRELRADVTRNLSVLKDGLSFVQNITDPDKLVQAMEDRLQQQTKKISEAEAGFERALNLLADLKVGCNEAQFKRETRLEVMEKNVKIVEEAAVLSVKYHIMEEAHNKQVQELLQLTTGGQAPDDEKDGLADAEAAARRHIVGSDGYYAKPKNFQRASSDPKAQARKAEAAQARAAARAARSDKEKRWEAALFIQTYWRLYMAKQVQPLSHSQSEESSKSDATVVSLRK